MNPSPARDRAESPDPLLLLRAATSTQHDAIEAQPLVGELLSPGLSMEHYLVVLQAFHAWYDALEVALENSGFLEPERSGAGSVGLRFSPPVLVGLPASETYRFLSRAAALRGDLFALGARPAPSAPTALPFPDAVAAVPSPVPIRAASAPAPGVHRPSTIEETLGVLYVVEGATQGGRIIAPHVERRLERGPGQGTGHFRLYQWGEWPRFRALARSLLEQGDVAAACAAARQTFESLHRHLDEWLMWWRSP